MRHSNRIYDHLPDFTIAQAFSGIKSKETLRQKKQARLQGWCFRAHRFMRNTKSYLLELIELFGKRQAAVPEARNTEDQTTLDNLINWRCNWNDFSQSTMFFFMRISVHAPQMFSYRQ